MHTPPLPHPPAPGEPRRPNVTRRIWPDETQPLTDAGEGIPDADDTPTRLLPARQLRWEQDSDPDPDAPTVSSSRFGAPVSGPVRDAALSQSAGLAGRQISRNDWVLLTAAIGIVLVLVGTVAAFGLLGLPSASGNNAPAGAGATAATATPIATPAPTATATPLPAVQASFTTHDIATQGSWQGQYGAQGYVVIGDTQQLSASIQVAPTNQQEAHWADSSSDPRALQKASNPADRIAACWCSSGSFTIDVNITDGQTYQMALYVVDWDQQNRAEIVNILDPATYGVLDTRSVTSFGAGAWLAWSVRGHVALQITNAPGSPSAVVSGLFFASMPAPGTTPSASPAATDTPTTIPSSGGDATPTDTPSP
jgi:hypothetical protein